MSLSGVFRQELPWPNLSPHPRTTNCGHMQWSATPRLQAERPPSYRMWPPQAKTAVEEQAA
eukprot:8369738-Pyramimonas_sp.AAC.1